MKLGGTLVSAGRAEARVTLASFEWQAGPEGGSMFSTGKVSCKLTADHLNGIAFYTPLPVGTEYEFDVLAIQEIDPGLWAALHERRPVKIVFDKPVGQCHVA
jgi:hypothetical protein